MSILFGGRTTYVHYPHQIANEQCGQDKISCENTRRQRPDPKVSINNQRQSIVGLGELKRPTPGNLILAGGYEMSSNTVQEA